MKTYILDSIKRIKRKSESLDAKTFLCNKSWRLLNDGTEQEQFIFLEDSTLVYSKNGIAQVGKWIYVPGSEKLLVSWGDVSYLTLPITFNGVLALKLDGGDDAIFLIDQANNYTKKLTSSESVERYLSSSSENGNIGTETKIETEILGELCPNAFECNGGHLAVDLGLSALWAVQNVGASGIEDRGLEFAWADPSRKTISSKWSNWFFFGPSLSDIAETRYDMARYFWGGNWRLPATMHFNELLHSCKIKGYPRYLKFIAPNGNFITIVRGWHLWTSTAPYSNGVDIFHNFSNSQPEIFSMRLDVDCLACVRPIITNFVRN